MCWPKRMKRRYFSLLLCHQWSCWKSDYTQFHNIQQAILCHLSVNIKIFFKGTKIIIFFSNVLAQNGKKKEYFFFIAMSLLTLYCNNSIMYSKPSCVTCTWWQLRFVKRILYLVNWHLWRESDWSLKCCFPFSSLSFYCLSFNMKYFISLCVNICLTLLSSVNLLHIECFFQTWVATTISEHKDEDISYLHSYVIARAFESWTTHFNNVQQAILWHL